MADLRAATTASQQKLRRSRPAPDLQAMRAAFAKAERRLLLLDYDGTLVDIKPRPQDAAPPARLLALLRDLAALPDTTVAIVSGRSQADIERWMGEIPGLGLAVEHGALLREPGSKQWEMLRGGRTPWARSSSSSPTPPPARWSSARTTPSPGTTAWSTLSSAPGLRPSWSRTWRTCLLAPSWP
jgi:trehalose 6-phosphate synthase/phosphatase